MVPRKLTLDPCCADGRPRGPNIDDSIAIHDAEFAYYGEDPWQTVRRALNVVLLDAVGGDVEDPSNRSYLDDEVAAPERDLSDAIAAMQDIFYNVLTKQEQRVLNAVWAVSAQRRFAATSAVPRGSMRAFR